MDNNIFNSKDWGFCTSECKLHNEDVALHGALRHEERVDVLKEAECDAFLKLALKNGRAKYPPRILCIGEHLYFRAEYYWTSDSDLERAKWAKVTKAFLLNNKDELRKLNEQPDEDDIAWKDYYIESAGTCKGDSGGPMYQKIYKQGLGQK